MASETKQCPYCAETINANAVYCRYCHHDLLIGDLQGEETSRPAPEHLSVTEPQPLEMGFARTAPKNGKSRRKLLGGVVAGVALLAVGFVIFGIYKADIEKRASKADSEMATKVAAQVMSLMASTTAPARTVDTSCDSPAEYSRKLQNAMDTVNEATKEETAVAGLAANNLQLVNDPSWKNQIPTALNKIETGERQILALRPPRAFAAADAEYNKSATDMLAAVNARRKWLVAGDIPDLDTSIAAEESAVGHLNNAESLLEKSSATDASCP